MLRKQELHFNSKKMETMALIVGAGPSGLAVATCLKKYSIQSIILEREDCACSLWKKRSYDRLKLHLGKQFCSLPHHPHKVFTQTFISREDFIRYLDDYVSKFNLAPRYCTEVESALFDAQKNKWCIKAKNVVEGQIEVYLADFLVVASGENGEGIIPQVPGLDNFQGDMKHSCQYKSGKEYKNKDVLVVGCGNSGMEIALDLSNHGASSSIVVRNPFHVVSKHIIYAGMVLLKFFSLKFVDKLVMISSKFIFGDLSEYGIHRPNEGPFFLKVTTGRSPVIDVGTIKKIKNGDVKVFPAVSEIVGSVVLFENGERSHFDAIIFATGYRTTINKWLKDSHYIFNEEGMPKTRFPNHWKGQNGIYCAGLSRQGLAGISSDAMKIADDIAKNVKERMGV